jgi:hypothetical protein
MKGSTKYYQLCAAALQKYKDDSAKTRLQTNEPDTFQQIDDALWREYMTKLYDALNYYSKKG